jgi:hypothetical protein
MSRANQRAFPVPHGSENKGLTIREHLAAVAMQGLLVNYGPALHTPAHIAQWSLEYADALLAELSKGSAT